MGCHCRKKEFLSLVLLVITCCFPLPVPLECMPESFLYQDMCHRSCPHRFYADARHCVPCHEDCLQCNGPSADDCDLCAESSSVLYDGQCLDKCPAGTYYENETKDCKGKDPGYMVEPASHGILLRQSTFWGFHSASPRVVVPPLSLMF